VNRARFIAAARLEFLAEVIYYLLLAISGTCPLTAASTPTASQRVMRDVGQTKGMY
jgi:hypothetical protein